MTIRFFMLQAHYRSTLDFSVEALQAAEKGFKRLMEASRTLRKLKPSERSGFEIEQYISPAFEALDDDLNSPMAIACLFDGVKMINSVKERTETISSGDLTRYTSFFDTMVHSILGLRDEEPEDFNQLSSRLIEFILDIRQEAKRRKDFETSDRIRKTLTGLGIEIRDRKDGADWEYKP
jgi:cysteinyl-tRNA synthetase